MILAPKPDDFALPCHRLHGPRGWPRKALVAVLLVWAAGCAGPTAVLTASSPSRLRKERQLDALKSFEQRRDAAQLQAALDRWQQGDIAGCETRLAALVQRRPDDAQARLRLGEVLWSRGDAASAELHLRQAIALAPNLAEAHHALGLLLAATGRSAEAAEQFSCAAALEPENDVYRLTADSMPAAAQPPSD